jgi:hypothetical protein
VTTIAWDGKTLAADTLATSDGLRRKCSKLVVTPLHFYGGTGLEGDMVTVGHWVKGGAPLQRPTVEEDGIHGILVDRKTGRAFMLMGKNLAACPIHDATAACGSGRDFALAAMHLGKTAVEAVEVSAKFDVWTSLPVESAAINDPVPEP